MVYISSSNLTTSLRQSIMQTQSDLAAVNKEVSSGVYADIGLQLGGESGRAVSLAQQSSQLTSLTAANVTTSARLSATSSALDAIMSAAQAMSNTLIGDAPGSEISATIQTQAQSSLQGLIGGLNTSVGNQYIFAGTNTGNVPLASYATTLSTVDTALGSDLSSPSTMTGTQMQTYLDSTTSAFGSLFQSSGWGTLSSASSNTISSQISTSQSIKTSVSANQSAFQNIAQAYSMLSELGGKALTADATQAVIFSATSLLNKGIAGLTTIQANVGTAQNAVTNANDGMAAQQTVLTGNVADLTQVDTVALSTKLTQLNTQLSDSYSITSQLKSLSLVNYLTGG